LLADGSPLLRITFQKLRTGPALDGVSKFPTEIVAVLHAGVVAQTARRRMPVDGVAAAEHATLGILRHVRLVDVPDRRPDDVGFDRRIADQNPDLFAHVA